MIQLPEETEGKVRPKTPEILEISEVEEAGPPEVHLQNEIFYAWFCK